MTRFAALLASFLAASLMLASCSGGSNDAEENGRVAAVGSGDAQTVALEMRDDLQFHPNVVTAQVGTLALTADNVGNVPHDLEFREKGLGAMALLRGGKSDTLSVRFNAPGTYTFVCTIHPGMDGRVIVAAAR